MDCTKNLETRRYLGESVMILHGILTSFGTIDNLIHEIKSITDHDAIKKPREINWNKTKVYDNSNRGQKKSIYTEEWR